MAVVLAGGVSQFVTGQAICVMSRAASGRLKVEYVGGWAAHKNLGSAYYNCAGRSIRDSSPGIGVVVDFAVPVRKSVYPFE